MYPQNSYDEALNPHVTTFNDMIFKEAITVKWGHKGGALSHRTGVLKRREGDTRGACTEDRPWEDTAKRWPPASQEERLWWNQPHSHPDLGLLASKSEKGILPLKPPTLECSVMTAWPLTYSFNSTLSLKKKKKLSFKKNFIYLQLHAGFLYLQQEGLLSL